MQTINFNLEHNICDYLSRLFTQWDGYNTNPYRLSTQWDGYNSNAYRLVLFSKTNNTYSYGVVVNNSQERSELYDLLNEVELKLHLIKELKEKEELTEVEKVKLSQWKKRLDSLK